MKVSFDFDDCLEDNKFVQTICKVFLSSNNEVFILTARDSNSKNQDVWKLVDKFKIEKSNVIMTNGDEKLNYILKNKIDFHFDDSADEIIKINQYFKDINKTQPGILVNFDSEELSFLLNWGLD